MQNFSLSYYYHYDDPFNPEYDSWYEFEDGSYDGKEVDLHTDEEEFLSYVKEIREIIKRDMNRIRNKCVFDLNNGACLIKELDILIDTIDNGLEYDFSHGHNFFFFTDNYLCFNNYENFVDELELGELGGEAATHETIAIVDRSYKNFYFVRIKTKVLEAVKSTTVNAYSLKDGNVKKSKVNLKRELRLQGYNDEGIKKLLSIFAA